MRFSFKHFTSTVLPYSILLIAVYSVLSHHSSKLPILDILNITSVWWAILIFILILFYFANKYFIENKIKKEMLFLNLYLMWMVISIIRGVFAADIYWDWKALVFNSMGILMPIVAYSATNKVIVQSILSVYVKYGLPLFLILILLIRKDAFGFFLIPVSFLLLFLPAFSNRQRLILLFFTMIIFLADLGARSNVIKFGFPIIVLIIYYLRNNLSIKLLERVRILIIIFPIFLFILASTNVFNIFKMDDYLGENKITKMDEEGSQIEENLAGDTRSFLYIEVIQSAIKNDYWIFGRTPARGNDSPSFGPLYYELTKRDERMTNEVGVLNVFTWTGMIGLILYLLVFFRASYLAINHSQNIYSKMLGIYVAFRWSYSWVEDVNSFTLNYFILFIMIGLCFSYSFRMMNDYEVTIWIRGVFDKRYINFEEYLKREVNEK